MIEAEALRERGDGLMRGRLGVAIVLVLALLVAVLSLARSDVANSQTKSSKRTSVTTMNEYEMHLAAAINTTRNRHGLPELKLVDGLMRSAGKHSLQMAVKGYFAHSSANGASFITRLRSFYGGGNSNLVVGENLLWTAPQITPREVVWRWLRSSQHRLVLLSPRWRVFGVGVVSSNHGAGVFRGRPVMLVTADFAVKR